MVGLGLVIEELRSEDLSSVPVDRLANELVRLREQIDLLEVEWGRRLAAYADGGGIDLEGHTSVTAFLKHRCRMSGARAQKSVTLANRLAGLPLTEKMLWSGDLSLDQARVVADVPERLWGEVSRDEPMLMSAVAGLSVADTRRAVTYWQSAVDGPGCEAEAEELFAQRYLYGSRTFQGMVKVDGLLDPVNGELFLTALAAATPPRREGDERTAGQRRADALTDMARSFLDSGVAAGSEKPHLLVLTDLDALRSRAGGVHETSSGQVLTPEQVRETACDASISRVVFGSEGQPVDIGRATRVVPPAMRRAVVARDRHCRYPGCDRPARWCDVHHIQHWADGGPTAVHNLTLRCQYHHTLEHHQEQGRAP